jgi:glyoxylase-like metal-dependent hydrolase (beta-lactamase superfamily II)
MIRTSKLLMVLAIFMVTGITADSGLAQSQATRTITRIAGDLYRFQNDAHVAVFLVTEEGIILADPISRDASTWLKAELDERFGVPVRYVIYSHDHADHTSGGEVFADTATFVGHTRAAAKIAASGHTPVPTVTFDDTMELSLGDSTVELIWPGLSHSDNLIVVLFPQERALFAVDLVAVRRLPYRRLPQYYIPDTIESLKVLEALDFDILIPGHGPAGTKADLVDHRHYLEDLLAAVTDARARGLSLAEARTAIRLDDYAEWDTYQDWLGLNIEGMYRILDSRQ